jgi:TolB protein
VIYERVRDDDPLTWRRLADLEGSTQSPCWSPDGQRIAFRRVDEEERHGIYVASVDGSAVRRVADVTGSDDPLTWSPDGRSIAYAAPFEGSMDIFRLDINTRRPTRVTTDGSADTSPSWSRNGREIAFCSNRTGSDEVWTKDLESGRLSQLTEGGDNRYPVFSNLGDRIAWVSKTDVVILDRDTGMRAYARGHITYRPSWSPNDRYIALESEASGSRCIYIIFANVAGTMQLTKPPRATGMPSWNPRGNQIAVASNQDGRTSVFVLSGLEDYMKRLQNPPAIKTFSRGQ